MNTLSERLRNNGRHHACSVLRSIGGLGLVLLGQGPSEAQTILNGDLLAGAVHWGCSPNVVLQGVVGGIDNANKVAVMSGGLNILSTADDRRLCQTISGFTVGRHYVLAFRATRATSILPPATVTVRVRVDGTSVDQNFSRSGGFSLVRSEVEFVATAASHTIRFDPTSQALVGVVLDDISITGVSSLPVELMYFQAVPHEGQVDLAWATASESDNASFSVERSQDMGFWTEVCWTPGQGDAQGMHTYGCVDAGPPPGTLYYRLRQTDTDGATTCSDVQVVEVSPPADDLKVWPNPTDGRLFFANADPGMTVQIADAQGRRSSRTSTGSDIGEVDVSGLPPGHYRLMLGNGRTAAFIRQ